MQGWQVWHRPLRHGEGGIRRALAALLCALVLTAASGARASDKVYTVANYPVQAVAENAVAAKRHALADGQQAAFRSLLKRLMPVTAYPRVKQLASIKAADLVDAVRVRSERNSATEYLASYDFTFRAKTIRDILRREGIPFTDVQAPVTTLSPVWQGGSARDEAAWTAHWKGLDLEYSLTPIKLAALRKDTPADLVAAFAAGEIGATRTLVARYKSERLLVAFAGIDAATGRLAVTLAGVDAVGPFVLPRQYRVDPSDPGYARELAAVVALRTIEGRWKAVHSPESGGGPVTADIGGGSATDLLIAVEFRGMSEWQDISRKLSGTPGIEELDVAGLSARGARVTLRYPAGAEQLADELGRRGLSLRSNGGGWVLSVR